MTPGPVEISPRVLAALSQPSIYHYDAGFIELFKECTEKTRKIFDSRDGDVLLLQGEGVLGLEAAVTCTIDKGESVLVFENGPFGKQFGEYVKNIGAHPIFFHASNDTVFDKESAAEFLERNSDATAITIVHCETPAGLLNNPEPICRKAKELGMLTIVDCVATLGGAEFRPTDWAVDIAVAASQKCLGSTPGITPMLISDVAWQKMESKKDPIRNSYLSLLDWKDTWLSMKSFPFTPFIADIYALSEALDEILDEGLERVLNRHLEASNMARKRVRSMGLSLWPIKEEYCSPTVTAIKLPAQLKESKIIQQVKDRYGILIGGGYRELKGQVLRIGHMGYQANRLFVSATMDALEDVLNSNVEG
jgi:pyridoxamine--pyruvate transaminase